MKIRISVLFDVFSILQRNEEKSYRIFPTSFKSFSLATLRIYGFSYFCIYPPTYKPIYHTRPKFTSCKHQSKWLPYTFFGSCMDLTMGIFATQTDFLILAIFCASIVQSWQIRKNNGIRLSAIMCHLTMNIFNSKSIYFLVLTFN